jgi:hypothetical protein
LPLTARPRPGSVAHRQPARPCRPRRTLPGFSRTVPAAPPPQPWLPSCATPAPSAPVELSSCHRFAPQALLHKQVNFLVIYFIFFAAKGLFSAANSGHRKYGYFRRFLTRSSKIKLFKRWFLPPCFFPRHCISTQPAPLPLTARPRPGSVARRRRPAAPCLSLAVSQPGRAALAAHRLGSPGPSRPRRPRSHGCRRVPPPPRQRPSCSPPATILNPEPFSISRLIFLVIYFISSARKGLFTAADSGHRK